MSEPCLMDSTPLPRWAGHHGTLSLRKTVRTRWYPRCEIVTSQGVWRREDQILILCPDWCLVRAWAWQVRLHLPDHWWLLAAAWEGPRHSEDGGRSIEVRVILKSNKELNEKQKLGSQMASSSSLTTCTARDSASVSTAAPDATPAQVWDGNRDSVIQPIKLK